MTDKRRQHSIWKRNGLTLVMLLLFAGSAVGQLWTGYLVTNSEHADLGVARLSWGQYLRSGECWEALAENWESEFLQMAAFVLLSIKLYQKGSSQSKDPDAEEEVDEDPAAKRHDPDAPWPVRRGGWWLTLYSNSLSLCFLLLFAICITLHAMGGAKAHSVEEIANGRPPVSTLAYLGTSQFWFESFQNWQSEFLSLAAMVYLTVYLRQKGSPESKPVAAPHDETGD